MAVRGDVGRDDRGNWIDDDRGRVSDGGRMSGRGCRVSDGGRMSDRVSDGGRVYDRGCRVSEGGGDRAMPSGDACGHASRSGSSGGRDRVSEVDLVEGPVGDWVGGSTVRSVV